MKMKRFIDQGILLSFAIALVFSGAYSQTSDDSVQLQPCKDSFAFVGAVACDENAECTEVGDAISCQCKDGYVGDGWAVGSRCIEAGNNFDEGVHEREKRGFFGMWSVGNNQKKEPCTGLVAFLGTIICDRKAQCMQGYKHAPWLKCFCPEGYRGNGISYRMKGTGCY